MDELWQIRNKIDDRLQSVEISLEEHQFLTEILGNIDDLIAVLED